MRPPPSASGQVALPTYSYGGRERCVRHAPVASHRYVPSERFPQTQPQNTKPSSGPQNAGAKSRPQPSTLSMWKAFRTGACASPTCASRGRATSIAASANAGYREIIATWATPRRSLTAPSPRIQCVADDLRSSGSSTCHCRVERVMSLADCSGSRDLSRGRKTF